MILLENDNIDLDAIAESGQCFRWHPIDGGYRVIAFEKVLHLFQRPGENKIHLDCSPEEYEHVWKKYLDLDTDYHEIINCIPDDDVYLKTAAECGCGIRILRQDPWETLVTFLLSQRKNIPAIKQAVEKICRSCGRYLGEEDGTPLYTFPSPCELASMSLEQLLGCSLGYRAKYIQATSNLFSNGSVSMEKLNDLSDSELFDALCSFYGVGKKIALCTMLFGFHRMDAFPVDVWMNKVSEKRYGGAIPMERYSPWGGVMQQYMFAYERKLAVRKADEV
ncbi:MAG: DNA-3-methyladenine glycosylase 2 family protein [Oscillospiraceae bacterium]|nr:DNA-3-methyladenine glycosylase 2 family protein [Oscillospiraceae bacterium]